MVRSLSQQCTLEKTFTHPALWWMHSSLNGQSQVVLGICKLDAWYQYCELDKCGLSRRTSEDFPHLQCSQAASHLQWTRRCRTLRKYPGSRPNAHRQSSHSDPTSKAAAQSNSCQIVHKVWSSEVTLIVRMNDNSCQKLRPSCAIAHSSRKLQWQLGGAF